MEFFTGLQIDFHNRERKAQQAEVNTWNPQWQYEYK